MSYDLQLYLSKAQPLTPPPTGETFQFAVDSPARCEDDDVPPEYRPLIGRRRWLVGIYIEGAAPPDALADFEDWLAEQLKATKGVVIDPQAGTWQSAAKLGVLPGTLPSVDITFGEMNFYMEDANAFYNKGFARMLEVIREVMPDALPTRFGEFEPLQGQVEDGDTRDLEAAFRATPRIFMKAKTPFSHIYLSIPCDKELEGWHPNHFLKDHYLAARVTFELRPKAFENSQLVNLFRALSDALGVFYADLRKSESPIRAWFWTGLPAGPVEAFAIGPPYSALWSEAVKRGVALSDGRVFVAPTRLDPVLPTPPEDLADPGEEFQPHQGGTSQYAKTFPFKVPNVR